MKPGKVYTLTNPVGNIIFYVGSTSIPLSARLSRHIYNARNMQSGSVGRYIGRLTLKPYIEAIECFDSISKKDLMASELFWIRQLKSWGFPLVNDGMPVEDRKPKMLKLSTDDVSFLVDKKNYVQIIRAQCDVDIPENTLSYVIKRGHCTDTVYKKIQLLLSKLKELDYSKLVVGHRIVKVILSESQVKKLHSMMAANPEKTLREIGICRDGMRESLKTHLMRYDKFFYCQSILGE